MTRSLLSLGLVVFWISSGYGEVVLDGTMGRSGPLAGPHYAVTGDLGQQSGGNLFHSFRSFSIDSTESATFSGPNSVQNVISRVTGGGVSNIDGLLRSTIPGADLYFINPAGVIFGEHAQLDVGGSFHVSTADYIRLGDTGRFDATNPANSVLTVAPPSAFGFLSSNPKDITVNGSLLEVKEGKTLSLVGGDLSIANGNLYAPSGTINLISAASPGDVSLQDASGAPFFHGGLGDISIRDETIAVDGSSRNGIFIMGGNLSIERSSIQSVVTGSSAGSPIDIVAGGHLNMTEGIIITVTEGQGTGGDISLRTGSLTISGGGQIITQTSSGGQAGDLSIQAEGPVVISGHGEKYRSALFSSTDTTGSCGNIYLSASDLFIADQGMIINASDEEGKRGDIGIHTGTMTLSEDARIVGANISLQVTSLDMSDGAYIWSPAPGSGDERRIRVEALESVHISGQGQTEEPWRGTTAPLYTGIHTDVFVNADGNAGDIFITSPSIVVENSGQIGARTYTDGQGGDITIETDRITMLSGGQISTDSDGSSFYRGPAGNVTVSATEGVILSGNSGELNSGFTSATRSGAGAGRITVTTPFLRIVDGGNIRVATGVFGEGSAGEIIISSGRIEILSGGGISSSSSGYGEEGFISIRADGQMLIDNGFIVSFGFRSGKAGRIDITTPSMEMEHGTISTIAYGDYDGGDIRIIADKLSLSDDSVISSESQGYGKAGSISIQASDYLRCEESSINTASDLTTGGNIEIIGGSVQLTRGSQVTATVAGGEGSGGNVTIQATSLVALEDSDITARADQGFGGNIIINAEVVLFSMDIDLNASSNVAGREGKVQVNAPVIDFSSNMAVLPERFLNIETLMPKRCAEREEDASSFLVRGRDGLPPYPGGLLQGR